VVYSHVPPQGVKLRAGGNTSPSSVGFPSIFTPKSKIKQQKKQLLRALSLKGGAGLARPSYISKIIYQTSTNTWGFLTNSQTHKSPQLTNSKQLYSTTTKQHKKKIKNKHKTKKIKKKQTVVSIWHFSA